MAFVTHGRQITGHPPLFDFPRSFFDSAAHSAGVRGGIEIGLVAAAVRDMIRPVNGRDGGVLVDLDLDAISRWAAEVSVAAERRPISRHIDEFGVEDVGMRDPARLLGNSASAFEALCRGVDRTNRLGVAAGLVLPLEVTDALPAPRSLRTGIDFLREHLHRDEPPGLYLLPVDSFSQWSDRDEDYRFPFDPRSVVDIPVDSAFVRYLRSDNEIAIDDVYHGAIYLIRSPKAQPVG
ncbi:hypothetical protein D5S18_06025 [Nocardia panacis]|uniref:Uncharacterized protein n=1 Tax=Nocardia panacis TaxID=2340916 RepID=A0A3A4KXK5_9NOCA|nr:hypothetical protein [Nocardia panacis]RJO78439.1 hypothetical protein D5S18_06025 [Nocardia panacis]